MTKFNNKQLTGLLIVFAMLATLAIPSAVFAQGQSAGRQEKASAKVAERKDKAKASLEDKLAERETKQADKLQERCEKQSEKIQKIMLHLTKLANNHLRVMDSFYLRVQGFYDKGQLTVSNYEELTANVDVAKAAAELEVATLQEQTLEIDCTDPEVVVDVRAYRNSVGTVKSSLKNYRKSLVVLISAMRSAAAEEKIKTDDSSEESETEVETDSKPENGAETEETGAEQ